MFFKRRSSPSLPVAVSSQIEACIVALLVGVMVFGLSYYTRTLVGGHAGDFSWPLNAARVLLQGENPYYRRDLGPSALSTDVLLYPMPAILLALPFTPFSDAVAVSLFLACSSTVLAYAVQTRAPHSMPMVLSAPFWTCILAGQWSILITAFLLLPLLAPFTVVKPTSALTAIAIQPSRYHAARVVVAMVGICIITWPILWSWPLDWLHNLPQAHFRRVIVALTLPGLLVWVAALRWRIPIARVFLALSVLPQFPNFYDHVALGLIPHTKRRGVALAGLSWVIFIVGRLLEQQLYAVVVLYLAALWFLMTAPVQKPPAPAPAVEHNPDVV
jgi:hypothetical protein